MIVLIIDPDEASREAMVSDIVWNEFNITIFRRAKGLGEAIRLLTREDVDLILCAMNMPDGTGLDLLTWLQEQQRFIECILMTDTEDPALIDRAALLHAFACCPKTAGFQELSDVIKEAVMKIRRASGVADLAPMMLSAAKLAEHLFRDILLEDIAADEALLTDIISAHYFPFDTAQQFYPVRMIFYKYKTGFGHQPLIDIKALIDHTIKKSIGAQFPYYLVRYAAQDILYYTILIQPGKHHQPAFIQAGIRETFLDVHQDFTSIIANPPTIYIFTQKYYPWELSLWRMSAEAYDRNNVRNHYRLTVVDQLPTPETADMPPSGPVPALPENTRELIESGQTDLLSRRIRRLLTVENTDGDISRDVLQLLIQDLLKEVYQLLDRYGIASSSVLNRPLLNSLFESASYSSVDLIRWLTPMLSSVSEAVRQKKQEMTPESMMISYIRTHYQQKITRQDIAEAAHLNADYAGRIFKKATGASINDYLTRYRIDRAKELLQVSAHSISDISQMVGFDSFSHFSATFRTLEGFSPREYKNGIMKKKR